MDATTSSTGAMAASSSSAASSSGAPSSPSSPTSPTTTILVGTLTTSATAAFVTGLHGIWTNRPQYTVATGLAAANSGVTAATFFSLRELVIRPLLQDHVPPPSSIRRENLIESGVSGALTGGLLRGIRSGPPAAVSGALILGTLTTSLQYAFNAFRARPSPSSSTPSASASLTADPPKPTPTQSNEKTTTHRLTDTLLALFGIYPITLDEQIASLKRKRDAHVRKIREIEDRLGVEHDEGLVPGEGVSIEEMEHTTNEDLSSGGEGSSRKP